MTIDFSKQDPRLIEAARNVASAVSRFQVSGFRSQVSPRALLVGGFVRDALLGIKSDDLDMEVYGVPADQLESLLEKLYPNRFDLIGRAFGIFHIALDDGLEFEISIPRRDSKTGKGHKGFVVEGDPNMFIKEAARRRDFTINALALDPLTGEILDFYGGINDIRNKILRVTDEKL